MAIQRPLVSVSVVTYNHEKYIGDAIRSVLGQTFPDLELVIVDDGSTDRTPEVVAQFHDPRLVYIRKENGGPSSAANRAFAACRGRYIAVMAGDDLSHRDRVEVQLEAATRAPGNIIVSNLDYIDDDGRPLESCHYPKDQFAIPPHTRGQILERFFRTGNFITPISLFGEAEALRGIGPMDPTLYQLQDWEWLIRLAKRHDFTFLHRPAVSYRVRRGSENLSAPSPNKLVRVDNDQYLVFRRFFDGMAPELFLEAFREHLLNPQSRSPLEIAAEQAFLYARHPHFPLARLVGVEKLHALLNDPEGAEVLRTRFSFTPVQFGSLLLGVDSLNRFARYRTALYPDTGKGFNNRECCRALSNHLVEDFEITFDVTSALPVKALRWDPVEGQYCQVWLEEVSWRDRAGRTHRCDPAAATSNGRRGADGRFDFQRLDPMIVLPIQGEVASLTVRGRWQVTDLPTTLWQVNALLVHQEWEVQVAREEAQQRALQLQQCHQELRQAAVQLHEANSQLHVANTLLQQHQQELAAIKSSRSWRFFHKLRTLLAKSKRRQAA
jgi:glycosyltransferase involved in cell wall biosynthesis